jgi:hypothetical protein
MKIFKTSPKLHFGVTNKDPGLVFHFDDLNLLKSWSNLGLTDFQMTIENSKNSKKWKTCAHTLLMPYTN